MEYENNRDDLNGGPEESGPEEGEPRVFPSEQAPAEQSDAFSDAADMSSDGAAGENEHRVFTAEPQYGEPQAPFSDAGDISSDSTAVENQSPEFSSAPQPGGQPAPFAASTPMTSGNSAAETPLHVSPSMLYRTGAFLLGLGLMAATLFAIHLVFLKPSPVQKITLYYSDFRHEHLVPVHRTVHRTASPAVLLKRSLLELCYGPVANSSLPSVPQGTRLLGCWLHDGIAYADFSRELYLGLAPVGEAEIIAVRAIVSTVQQNVRGVKAVQILVEGRILPTLRGLSRTDRPLMTELSAIR